MDAFATLRSAKTVGSRRVGVDNPFSWDYLTAPIIETPTFGPFSVLYLVLFGVSFVVAVFLAQTAHKRWADNRIMRDLVQRASGWVAWVTGVGLVFFAIRALRFQFISFERRIWMYLAFLAYLAVVGYFSYYVKEKLPAQLAAHERRRERRKYHAQAATRTKARRKSAR